MKQLYVYVVTYQGIYGKHEAHIVSCDLVTALEHALRTVTRKLPVIKDGKATHETTDSIIRASDVESVVQGTFVTSLMLSPYEDERPAPAAQGPYR